MRDSAITTATASPMCRTRPRASAQRGGSIAAPPTPRTSHKARIAATPSAAISAPVSTACTPGTASAGAVSMLITSACACGERTKAQCSCPMRLMSATYRPWPVTRRRSSRRGGDAPMPQGSGAPIGY